MADAKTSFATQVCNKLFSINTIEPVTAVGAIIEMRGSWWFSRSGWWFSAEGSIAYKLVKLAIFLARH